LKRGEGIRSEIASQQSIPQRLRMEAGGATSLISHHRGEKVAEAG
jgi:hypothetical protein